MGDFEAHVTVGGDEGGRLVGWGRERGVKVAQIVLARGERVSQPMVTLRGGGSYREQYAAARRCVEALRGAGFTVVRVKVECAAWAEAVPAPPYRKDQYYEHHVKLALGAGAELGALARAVAGHGAHLSWNARRVAGGGRHERFVTQRCHGGGAGAARSALGRLLHELRGRQIVSVEREFVLYDSDLSVDEGWLDGGTTAGGEET
ncbi:hypothetical protein [Streptomyces sp. NPDC050560]|uniref:hypothetical protein n=1 Tax=Streptomyces sp. NPDC050560 TaxID=3365630 RepID=UPI0037B13FF8